MSDSPSPLRRPRGRPPSIDRTRALDAAVLAFWERGYDGASLTDLTDAMGLSRPSLYAGFGDKGALFLAALDRYGETVGVAPMAAFEAEPEIARAVHAFLQVSAEGNTSCGRPRGCLFACCAAVAAERDDAVRTRLDAVFAQTEARLATRFRSEPGLAPHPTPAERAALMVDFMNAQAVRARAGATRKDLLHSLRERVSAVMAERI